MASASSWDPQAITEGTKIQLELSEEQSRLVYEEQCDQSRFVYEHQCRHAAEYDLRNHAWRQMQWKAWRQQECVALPLTATRQQECVGLRLIRTSPFDVLPHDGGSMPDVLESQSYQPAQDAMTLAKRQTATGNRTQRKSYHQQREDAYQRCQISRERRPGASRIHGVLISSKFHLMRY